MKVKEIENTKYSANFLWGFDDNSIESLGYEFVNAKTEEYQKECWSAMQYYFKLQSKKAFEAGRTFVDVEDAEFKKHEKFLEKLKYKNADDYFNSAP